jgi:hypothetical protein
LREKINRKLAPKKSKISPEPQPSSSESSDSSSSSSDDNSSRESSSSCVSSDSSDDDHGNFSYSSILLRLQVLKISDDHEKVETQSAESVSKAKDLCEEEKLIQTRLKIADELCKQRCSNTFYNQAMHRVKWDEICIDGLEPKEIKTITKQIAHAVGTKTRLSTLLNEYIDRQQFYEARQHETPKRPIAAVHLYIKAHYSRTKDYLTSILGRVPTMVFILIKKFQC